MDLNIVSHIMKFSKKNSYSEVGALCMSVDDIINHINEMYPFFDIKAYLLETIDELHKYSSAIQSPAYDLFNYMNNILHVDTYSIGIAGEHHVYPIDPQHIGKLYISICTDHLFNIDNLRIKYPSAHVLCSDDNYYYEIVIDMIPTERDKMISDTRMIGEYKRILSTETENVSIIFHE